MRMWIYYRRFFESGHLGIWQFDGWETPGSEDIDRANDLKHINDFIGYECDLVKGLYDLNTGKHLSWVWLESEATKASIAAANWWPW